MILFINPATNFNLGLVIFYVKSKTWFFIRLDNVKDNDCQVQQVLELSRQETQLSEMVKELKNFEATSGTLQMFLKYCPDAVTYLLDKCLVSKGIQVNMSILLRYYIKVL